MRGATQQCAEKSAGAVQEAADARTISGRAPRRRSVAAVRLRDAVCRRGRLFGDAARDRRATWACGMCGSLAQSSGTMRLPTIRCNIAAAGSWIATICTRRRASGLTDIDFLETYDDYPVINVLQFEGLGFCGEGGGPDFVRANTFEVGRKLSVQHLRRPIVGRAGRRGRRTSRHHRGHPAAHRPAARRASAGCAARRRVGLRHDQLRSRRLQRRRRARGGLNLSEEYGHKGCLSQRRGRDQKIRSCARGSRHCRRRRAAASRSA